MENAITLIPDMTHPLGKVWEQPKRESITLALGKAWVSKQDFEKLKNYSASNPSGVYAGKMWRREAHLRGKFGNRIKTNFLCWYEDSEKDGFCDVKEIELIIN